MYQELKGKSYGKFIAILINSDYLLRVNNQKYYLLLNVKLQ